MALEIDFGKTNKRTLFF